MRTFSHSGRGWRIFGSITGRSSNMRSVNEGFQERVLLWYSRSNDHHFLFLNDYFTWRRAFSFTNELSSCVSDRRVFLRLGIAEVGSDLCGLLDRFLRDLLRISGLQDHMRPRHMPCMKPKIF